MNKDLILRLTKYKRLLHKFRALGLERVFSNNLGDAIGVAPALVRKDFSLLNLPGHKRGGYNIDDLAMRLDTILGKDKEQKVIIVGCGKIGTALMDFEDFKRDGISIVAGFDVQPEKASPKNQTPIYHIDELNQFVSEHDINVAIIATPENAAADILHRLHESGVLGILNFASVDLKCAAQDQEHRCVIHNVNIGLELEHIFYQLNMAKDLEDKTIEKGEE